MATTNNAKKDMERALELKKIIDNAYVDVISDANISINTKWFTVRKEKGFFSYFKEGIEDTFYYPAIYLHQIPCFVKSEYLELKAIMEKHSDEPEFQDIRIEELVTSAEDYDKIIYGESI